MKQTTFKVPSPEDCQGSATALCEHRRRHTSLGSSLLVFMLLEGTQDFCDDTGILQGSGVP